MERRKKETDRPRGEENQHSYLDEVETLNDAGLHGIDSVFRDVGKGGARDEWLSGYPTYGHELLLHEVDSPAHVVDLPDGLASHARIYLQ
jgi:hypothetical protein